MEDAVGIESRRERTRGVGTTFDCDTRVGPIELTDRMEVTEWLEGRAIGVAPCRLVTGSGRFTLVDAPDGRTVFSWDETLRFPWWLGGPLGEVPGGWVLRRVWRATCAEASRPRRSWLQPGRHPSVDDELGARAIRAVVGREEQTQSCATSSGDATSPIGIRSRLVSITPNLWNSCGIGVSMMPG